MNFPNIVFFVLGLTFSLSSFSFKVALALKSLKASFKLIAFVLFLYSGLFLLTTLGLKAFLLFLEPLLSKAFYFHLFIAIGLILWGIYFFTETHTKKSAFILLFPCPICLLAMSLSSYIFLKTFSFPPILGGLLLGSIFSVLILIFFFICESFLFKNLSEKILQHFLGILMIIIGIYILGSFYFPLKIEELKTSGGIMSFTSFLENFLYLIASSLFVPVLLSLVLLVFWMVYQLGRFFREFAERRANEFHLLNVFKDKLSKIEKSTSSELIETEIEKLLQEMELKLLKNLDQIRFVVRVGPALGLLGTLIPMGVALAELAKGNLPKMAGNMVTAFTTTVVGLTCGIIAYLISLIKERWIRETLKEMNYLAELTILKNSSKFYTDKKEEEV